MLQIVRAGNSYPGTSGSPWFRPREEESGERAAWLNGPVQERARDPNSIDRLRERERERERETRRLPGERERETAREEKERVGKRERGQGHAGENRGTERSQVG